MPIKNLSNVDAGSTVSLHMPSAELGDNSDGMEAGVFSQSDRDDFECFCECTHTIAVHARKGASPLLQLYREFDFW